MDFKQRDWESEECRRSRCLNSNPSDRSPSVKAIPLLEVESARNSRLRCGIWRCAKLAWLQVNGIALTTPSETPRSRTHYLMIVFDSSFGGGRN